MKNKVHADTNRFWHIRSKLLNNKLNPLVERYYLWRMNSITRSYNAVIPLQTKIKGIPTTPHGLMGICISKNASIGEHCTIFQNVTIGSNTFSDSKNAGSPIIGDDVFIGANAVIIGNIHVREGTRIGAGCTVFESIPENSTVVAQAPRVIEHTYSRNNSFVAVKK